MHSLHQYLSKGLNRSFKIAFTILFIVINGAIIGINTLYINANLNTQNESLQAMVGHLTYYTDEETVVTYLEHYGHTHEVFLHYQTTAQSVDFVTETPPSENADIYTITYEGIEYGTLQVDNAQSNLFVSNLTYLFTVNIVIVGLYLSSLFYFNRKLNRANAVILNDLDRLNTSIKSLTHHDDYRFNEFNTIAYAFHEATQRLKKLQNEHTHKIQTLAHDIKTPLTIVNGLMEGVKKGRMTANEEVYQSIIEETNRINTLIEKIIEGDEQKVNAPLNLSELTKAVISKHKVLFDQKGVLLRYAIDADVHIHGYDEDIKRVLDHLLQNSLRFTPKEKHVSVKLNEYKKTLIIKDEGLGMDQAFQEELFTHQSTSESTGIGLKIVKHILDAHEADMTIDSAKGKGTTVTIHFHS